VLFLLFLEEKNKLWKDFDPVKTPNSAGCVVSSAVDLDKQREIFLSKFSLSTLYFK
jgi:hypothetical protein